MNCERSAELLPDYLAGTLSPENEDQLEDHLEQCAACKETVRLWNELALLPEERPSPALHERFSAMLNAYIAGRGAEEQLHSGLAAWLGGGWLRPAVAMACAVALLVAGFSAGRLTMGGREVPDDIAGVREELSNMRQLVVLSMLQQQSATERLQGVNWSTQQTPSDPKILEALIHTLRADSSVDVRLAALNALGRYGAQPQVRAGLLDALQPQQSPLVQVALIDLLVELRDRSAVQQLQKVRQDATLNPAVRQRAEWALGKLN